MPDPISVSDVHRIASLARLHVEVSAVERTRRELDAVLGYMDTLSALQGSDGVAGAAAPTLNRLADDVPGAMLPAAALMAMAPATDGVFVKIPKVLGAGS